MIKTLIRSLAMLAVVVGLTTAADAEDKGTMVVNLTTDDMWAGQMAMTMSRHYQKDGYDVVVFLNVRAVHFADTTVPQHTQAGSGMTAHEHLAEIIEGGGRVFVCPSCAKQAGLDTGNFIDGIEKGGPKIHEIIMAPNTQVMSF